MAIQYKEGTPASYEFPDHTVVPVVPSDLSFYHELRLFSGYGIDVCSTCGHKFRQYPTFFKISTIINIVCEHCLHGVFCETQGVTTRAFMTADAPFILRQPLGLAANQRTRYRVGDQPAEVYAHDGYLGIYFTEDAFINLYPVGYFLLSKALRNIGQSINFMLRSSGYISGADIVFDVPSKYVEIFARNFLLFDMAQVKPLVFDRHVDVTRFAKDVLRGFDIDTYVFRISYEAGLQLLGQIQAARNSDPTVDYTSTIVPYFGQTRFQTYIKKSLLRGGRVTDVEWQAKIADVLKPFGSPEDVLKAQKVLRTRG